MTITMVLVGPGHMHGLVRVPWLDSELIVYIGACAGKTVWFPMLV